MFRRLQNWLLVRQYACVPKKVADGTLVASSQPPPFIPSLLSQFSQSPSLKRCGRDGMRSDSTKTFHNGFDFGPSSSTFSAFSILHPSQLHFKRCSLFRIVILIALCATSSKQARDPTKLKRKLEPNFRHYFFAKGEIFDMNHVDGSMHRE